MTLPTIEQLFGVGATYDGLNLSIPASALATRGIDDPLTADSLSVFAATIKGAQADYFATNADLTVNADIQYSAQAPAIRNNALKTSFNYNVVFYGAYTTPTFDPDDV